MQSILISSPGKASTSSIFDNPLEENEVKIKINYSHFRSLFPHHWATNFCGWRLCAFGQRVTECLT
jgi:hypothetical protein